ncbi:hypothetical protein [Bdellovibrio sp. HCB337]|uniref:hypothetical protein n=1 Tax=Bdellovibrio sp. HCB337 TaxID=3394358 RepID=UPI0039A4A469
MKWIIASIAFSLMFGSAQARAGHEVGNGTLTNWHCAGHASIKNQNGTRVILPFQMRLYKKEMEVSFLDQNSQEMYKHVLSVDSAVYYKATGLVEIRSYKNSTSLTKELQAYATLRKVGQILSEPVSGSLVVNLGNEVMLSSHAMTCQDYF